MIERSILSFVCSVSMMEKNNVFFVYSVSMATLLLYMHLGSNTFKDHSKFNTLKGVS